jgi:hypothetical protein
MDPTKNALVNHYLSQQATAAPPTNHQAEIIPTPTQGDLDDFKILVNVWLEHDLAIEKLQVAIRERNKAKAALMPRILTFMSRYNIEDLNTKQGVLRYKVTQVKVPISQAEIKTRIAENIAKGVRSADEFNQNVFDNRQVIEKHSLKRVGRARTLEI